MKYINAFLLVAVVFVPVVNASTITCDLWQAAGMVNGANPTSGTFTNGDGVTFTVTVENTDGTDGIQVWADVIGGDQGNNTGSTGPDKRTDSGVVGNTSDDEGIRFTISATLDPGITLSSVSMTGISLNVWAVGSDTVDISDGSNTVNYPAAASNETFDYDNQMASLVPLSVASIGGVSDGSWQLVFTARDNTSGTFSAFSWDDIFLEYTLTIPPDTTPPTPNPMIFEYTPHVIDQGTIAMEAVQASDPSGVEYYFTCISGGGRDSGWQSEAVYIDTNLNPETEYTYTVKARDLSANQNITSESDPASAITPPIGNQLVNGDFEEGSAGQYGSVTIPGWTAFGVDGWIYNNAGQVLGTQSAKNWSQDTEVYQDIPVIPGHLYGIGAKLASFTDTMLVDRFSVVFAEWYNDSDMARRIEVNTVGMYVPADLYDIWYPIYFELKAPADANLLRIVFRIFDPEGGSPDGTANFDEFFVIRISCPGDLDGDCKVNLLDFEILASEWMTTYNTVDLSEMVDNWLNGLSFE